MRRIYELNGFIRLANFEEEEIPDWVTSVDDERSFFHLNLVTRDLFKKDLLPGIKAGSIDIDPNLLNKIRYYTTTHYQINGVIEHPLVIPPDFKEIIKDHQVKSVNIMLENPKFAFFLGTGTGKTMIVVIYLMNMPTMTEGVLVVTTKKSISQYAGVCRKYLSDRYTVIEVDDVELLDKTTKDYIYVINYEKLGSLKRTFKAVIIDESHLAKDISSDRNYFLREICKKAQYTYAYTGTPQDKRRYDIFPQLVLLDQRFMPGKTNFYKRYFKLDEYHQPDTELKERSNELTSMLNEISWGESSEKLIELTKENDIHVMVDIDLAVYNELSKERIVYVGDAPIVADNIAILKMKLREICNGHLRDEEHRLYNLYRSELEIPKIKALAELVNNLDNAIIYTQFIPDITAVTYLLTYLKKSHVTLTGLSAKKMGQRIDAFKKGEYKFLVMQAASGNAALDLTVTNNVVFYSMPESYIIYHQCKSRIRRLGQVKECNYYHLICRDTVEEKIYKALRSKKGFSTRLFKSYN